MEILVESEKYGSQVILLDDEDYPLVEEYDWFIKKGRNTFYAETKNEYWLSVKMHRLLFGYPDKTIEIDHINHNGLDNRRENLRLCSSKENNWNQEKHMNAASTYKGVFADKKKWRAQIQRDGTSYRLGSYDNEIHAALAYNEAAKKYFGEFATLNDVTMVSDYPGFTRHQEYRNRNYYGVYFDKGTSRSEKKWRVIMKIGTKWKSFGRYFTEREAAKRYNEIALSYFGINAILNEDV